jgi:hypothetical protein
MDVGIVYVNDVPNRDPCHWLAERYSDASFDRPMSPRPWPSRSASPMQSSFPPSSASSLILGYWLSHETRGTEIVDRVVKQREMAPAMPALGRLWN